MTAIVGTVVVPSELSAAERAVWRSLCEVRPELASPFYSPAYAEAVGSIYPHARVAVLRSADEIVGFFPFQYANVFRRKLRAAERIGGEMTDHAGVVANAGLKIDPATLLRAARLSYFYFTHLDESQLLHGLTGEHSERGVTIEIGRTAAAYWHELRSRERSAVSDTERRHRNLIRDLGPLRFRLHEPEPAAHIDFLIEMKTRQYERTGVGSALRQPWKVALLKRLARVSDPQCTGVTSTLHAGATWVASHFGLRHGGVLHYWFPVYNPALAKYSPGRQLLRAILLSADENGLRIIDRGAGESPNKVTFGNGRQVYYRGVWRLPGVRSLSAHISHSVVWRWQTRHGRRRDSALEDAPTTT